MTPRTRSGRLPRALVVAVTGVALAGAFGALTNRSHSDTPIAIPKISIPHLDVPDLSGLGSDSGADSAAKKRLETMRSRYLDALRAGDLTTVGLRNTAHDRLAVQAYSFFLTDMILATGFSPSAQDVAGYERDAATYERLLLAGKPLGDDIDITFSQHREFTYDGKTGTGGYRDPSKDPSKNTSQNG
jgi:hypothetical protein